MRYATLEQMQQMELGVTGTTRMINDVECELMTDGEYFGWAAKSGDDWDRIPEDEAIALGLINHRAGL